MKNSIPPCVIHEDEHLLVVNKPAGWNTHAPSPYAGEGIYDWLRHREPRWAALAIIHRLDKETSGVLVFGKTPLANKSLTEQFTAHTIRKTYFLLTDRAVSQREFTVKTKIARAGDRYASALHGESAETHFEQTESILPPSLRYGAAGHPPSSILAAFPKTGRTHQIRVHAAESGFPILGDTLYDGTPFPRVCLHAAEITLAHPATGKLVAFTAPVDFEKDLDCGDMSPLSDGATCRPVSKRGHVRALQTTAALRAAVIEPAQTDAFRLIHGASDSQPGWFVDKLGDFLLSQSEQPLSAAQKTFLEEQSTRGAYHKILTRRVQRATVGEASPQLALGSPAPEKFVIRENSVKFELSFAEGYSTGLFLDQRDNRRRFLTGHIAADFPQLPTSNSQLLNCFAYTCGFSVCAALASAHTTSLDLSKKYLEWGKRNFALNGLDPAAHDFIYGDTFDWLKRLAKKGRAFDAIVLDPPTFSRSKESGVFQTEKDYGKLVAAALPVLKPDGILLASTNTATLAPEDFLADVAAAIRAAGRKIVKQHYVPQPPDFPISRDEPGYLKTVWLRVR
ncbi:MAG: pseudouridine synthase [Verrucomicrobia bacterium]|nr:pseudouridine synthase [Verrucomicrobiota bacterium]